MYIINIQQSAFLICFFTAFFARGMEQPEVIEQPGVVSFNNINLRMANNIHAACNNVNEKFKGTYEEAQSIHRDICFAKQTLQIDTSTLPPMRDTVRDILQGILNDGTDINKKYEFAIYNKYPLHVAASKDEYTDLVDEFINKKANLHQEAHSWSQKNILHICANAPINLQKMIIALGNKKAKKMINTHIGNWGRNADDLGKTPLHFAAENLNKESITIMLNLGAEINALDSRKKTPLVAAMETDKGFTDTIREQTQRCLALLLQQGAKVLHAKASEHYLKKNRATIKEILQKLDATEALNYYKEDNKL